MQSCSSGPQSTAVCRRRQTSAAATCCRCPTGTSASRCCCAACRSARCAELFVQGFCTAALCMQASFHTLTPAQAVRGAPYLLPCQCTLQGAWRQSAGGSTCLQHACRPDSPSLSAFPVTFPSLVLSICRAPQPTSRPRSPPGCRRRTAPTPARRKASRWTRRRR